MNWKINQLTDGKNVSWAYSALNSDGHTLIRLK